MHQLEIVIPLSSTLSSPDALKELDAGRVDYIDTRLFPDTSSMSQVNTPKWIQVPSGSSATAQIS
jgi:hypothetical protein